jgi:methyltransferase family protein
VSVSSSRVRVEDEAGGRACAWCGHVLGSTATNLRGRIRCDACGVANTHPWPTEAELNAAYGDWYRPSSGRFSGVGDAVLRRTRGLLARRLDRIAPPGRILDVGAGDGALLDALSARGREARGLEREATRPDVIASAITELSGEWAAIVFWHSLEHLPDAGRAIDHAASLLAARGVVVVAVPNAASLQARLFGNRWLALDLPRHLVHLPADALIERLRQSSLEVRRVSYWRGGQVMFGWVHGLVGMLPGHPDLYDAIRRPAARRERVSGWGRVATLAAGTLLAPVAALATVVEIAAGRGGTVYVEARRG